MNASGLRCAAVCAAVWMALAAGCSSPHLYYAGPARASHVTEAQRTALLALVEPALAQAGIARIEVLAGQQRIVRVRSAEGALTLEGVPALALQAARVVLDPQYTGAELDVCVEGAGPEDPARIWSVARDLERGLVLQRGAALEALAGPDPSPAQLQQRFSIGPLEDTAGASWSADERRALARALELLTPAELELLAALPFERGRVGPDPQHAGLYVRTEQARGGAIRLFDLAFSDENSYVGGVDRAPPYAVYVVLHEIGHAIAKLYRERVLLQRQKDAATYNDLVQQVNSSVDQYNRGQQVLYSDRPMKAAERRALERRQQELGMEISRVKALLRRAKGQLRKMEKIAAAPTPMEQIYARLPRALDGPTPYGRTSVSESFAESFALFHVDRDSLRRISPEVEAWFASGEHLSLSAGPEEAEEAER